MLSFLMIVALTLVIATVAAAMIAGREIQRLKLQLSKLEQAKVIVHGELEEAKQRVEAANGTLGVLQNVKNEKTALKEKLLTELEELQEETVPDREITESAPLRPRDDSDDG